MWGKLAGAIGAVGTERHIDCLIDLIGADIAHDLVTVARYSATRKPEFVKHRGFSDEMVQHYLDSYYVFDPFYASWRGERRLGIMPLKRLAGDEVKRGQYIAGFLAQSQICDEVGIMLADGGDWCLGIFLDRTSRPFRDREIALLEERLPVFSALHALDIKARGPDFLRTSAPSGPAASPRTPCIPAALWPGLTQRERELVQLVLAGHPTAAIAKRLGITVGTAKNHRRRIYDKLDITTERELFLQFFEFTSHD
ncbi:helix-turn-helix transcriptional regulator [Pseudaminobacter salicylatoxidans]|uniref:helix-turn-helix transcriptional regulator n=1 Tax=Pseudaminobacter salicylatoxidans TaxID=93369 RepID=UPI0003012D63|nr:helix-turn-helix transcriptional regulator [Pseudaminobacter salicylatoxidans]